MRLAIRVGIGLSACLAACSLQMPSESDVFGAAGSKPAANGGAPGQAGMLGDSGSDDNGGAGSPADGAGGSTVVSNGSSGVGGLSAAAASGGSSGSSGTTSSAGSTSSAGAAAFDPTAGLVAHFTFDESSGAVATNAKDSTKNAKCIGACTHPEGKLGRAFGLRNNTSTSDWIELPAGIFVGHSALTLSVWLRDLSTSRGAAPLFHFSATTKDALYFVPDDSTSQSSSRGAHLGGVRSGSSFVDLWSTSPDLTDKEWHHVAVSWGTASIDLYIDGTSVGSGKATASTMPSQLAAASTNYLGRARDDSILALFGELDDLRIYDRALSASQLKLLYKVR